MVQPTVNTILPRSPFFLLFVPQNIDRYNKMRSNVCVNEMVPLGPYAAVVKGKIFFDNNGSKVVFFPRDEITDPPSTTVLPIDRHGFD